MRHNGKPFGFRFRQRGIGSNNRDGGIFRSCTFDVKGKRVRGPRCRPAEAAKFPLAFVRRGPEMRPIADRRLAERVHGNKGADAKPR